MLVWRLEQRAFYWFVEDQTHFGMPRGAKMSLARNEPILNVLRSYQCWSGM